jgi:hypothetical protein
MVRGSLTFLSTIGRYANTDNALDTSDFNHENLCVTLRTQYMELIM